MGKIRVATLKAEEVYHLLESCDYKKFNGFRVKMRSHRYRCFVSSGLACVHCKIEGTYFGVEKSTMPQKNKEIWENTPFHLNLYAIDNKGQEVLMTKDHIKPKSKGGKNHVDNYQTMCTYCNRDKGDIYNDK